jgi:2,3-bisphosphoglycerate-dependent phosphoglycerate mutase
VSRASRTAQILGEAVGIAVEHEAGLMEFNNGLVAGLTREEADRLYHKPERVLPHESYYGQETLIGFRTRAEAVLSAIVSGYDPAGRIAVVSHGGMINMLFHSFMKLPVECDCRVETADTGIHLWEIDGGARRIRFMNSTAHLL